MSEYSGQMKPGRITSQGTMRAGRMASAGCVRSGTMSIIKAEGDYEKLIHKPRINTHELIGDKTGYELDLTDIDVTRNVANAVPVAATASEILDMLK